MVTLKQIAAAAGVSTYTVSCSLNGSGAVGDATRERVRALAAEMGYERDTAAALMVGRRQRTRGASRQVVLGVIRSDDADSWGVTKGVGYHILEHGFPDLRGVERTLKAWWHQGMEGLIVKVQREGARSWLETEAVARALERFAVVTIGPSAYSHVRDSPVRMMDELLHQVLSAGYRRVAVLLGETDQLQDNRARLGATLVAREDAKPEGVELEIRRFPLPAAACSRELVGWLKKYRPEAVVAFPGGYYFRLQEAGFAMPGHFAFFGVPVSQRMVDTGYPLAGMRIQDREYQREALGLMEQLLKLRLRGRPAQPLVRLVQAEWRGSGGRE